MRTITRLELTNIQQHAHFACDFTPGVNVLYGESGSGKSTIMRALRSIYFNRPAVSVLRRHGSKKSSISCTFSDGSNVTREFSSTVNRYYLTRNGEEQKYDAVGKDIPDPVKEFLTTYPIVIDKTTFYLPIAEQLRNPLFFFDDNLTGAVKSKLLTYLTGNDVVDAVAVQLNKDIFNLNKQEIALSSANTETEKTLSQVQTDLDKLNQPLAEVKPLLDILSDLQKRYLDAVKAFDKYDGDQDSINGRIARLNVELGQLGTGAISDAELTKLGTAIKTFDTLASLINRANGFICTIDETTQQLGSATHQLIEMPEGLDKKISDFNLLVPLNQRTATVLTTIENATVQIGKLQSNIIDIPTNLGERITLLSRVTEIVQRANTVVPTIPTIQAKLETIDQDIFEVEDSIEQILGKITECPLYKKPCPLAKINEEDVP
jgi:DNA repair ATPase RecN